jgi:hypothetical protein
MSILKDLQDTLPPTNTRVERSTAESLNERIAAQTASAVAKFERASREEISRRIEELDREWDIERTLEANAATLAFTGAALALTVNRKFAWMSAVVTGFLLQHALQGWCPPVPLFRRAGVRTQREIAEEKTALRILRGDFQKATDAGDAIRQVRV